MKDKVEVKKTEALTKRRQRHLGGIMLCMLIILLFAVACGKEDTEPESSEVINAIRMTREYAIEHGILTEEELVGVDFEAMAEEYDWQEGSEGDFDVKSSFLSLKSRFPLPGYGFDYSWLTTAIEQEDEFTKEDIEQIKVIGFSYQDGDSYKCMIFDFTECKAFLGENIRLYDIGAEPTMEISLTNDQMDELKSILRNSSVYKWNREYEGTNENTTGYYWWNLCYALEDGRRYFHSGSGVMNGIPDGYHTLKNGLDAFWHEK